MTKTTTFNEIRVGDIIRIEINDCGAGNAIVLSKDENSIAIRMDTETFTPCYSCQSMGSPFMEVHEDEIHDIQLVHRFKKDSYHKHDGTLIKPKNEEIEDLENRSKCVIKAVKAAPPVETIAKGEYVFRVLSEDNTFWCDVYPDEVRFAYTRENDNPMPIPGYGVIINYFKEDDNMSTTVKENNHKEETKMTTNANNSLQEAKQILERINNNPKVQDEGYLDRDTLREALEPFEFGFTRKTTRKQMIKCLIAYIKEQEDLLEEIAWENEPYDYPRVKEAIYKAVILKANKNQQHNFISNWIFTSVVAEAVIGKPLKEVNNGVVVENYKSFTEVERELIKKVRSRFLEEAQWVKVIKKVKYGDKMVDELRGYTIPAKSIVYGRHKWLGVACVYKFDQHTTTGVNTIEYHVSLSGIKNTQTGVVTPLTDESYAKLDELCTFVR
jgi:hypothetical protein